MRIKPLKLNGVYEIVLKPLHDDRGYFMRTYDEATFHEHGLTTSWVQENQSLSTREGIIRGLHFQRPPYAETKLVGVSAGTIMDVFVDLRRDSETYGQWDSIILSADDHNMIYIPKGFAHGFCTLTEWVLVSYKTDACYSPESEGGIRWDDRTLDIRWPTDDPYLSPKDIMLPDLDGFVSPFQATAPDSGSKHKEAIIAGQIVQT